MSVIRTAEQVTWSKLTLRQTITFSVVTFRSYIGRACAIKRGLGRVLVVVKEINFSANGLGSDKERVLRHIASPVNLAIVINLLNDLDLENTRKGRERD